MEVAVCEGGVHGPVDGVETGGRVEAERAQVELLEQVQGLAHGRALRPGRELVDLDAAVARVKGLLDAHAPAREVGVGEEAALERTEATISRAMSPRLAATSFSSARRSWRRRPRRAACR
jgi:hypothetical protein